MSTTIKNVDGVCLQKLDDGRFIITRDDPLFVYVNKYLGSGVWGNSRPMEFSLEEKALSAFNRAIATHLAEKFIICDINFCRDTVTNNVIRYYGVTLKKDTRVFSAGSKCNHVRWTRGSSVIKICDEDDTVIENLVFGKNQND